MNALSRITIDPEICGGRPCIRGLRVRVKDVLDQLPPALARRIAAAGHVCEHVADRGLLTAADPAIRACATDVDAIIIEAEHGRLRECGVGRSIAPVVTVHTR